MEHETTNPKTEEIGELAKEEVKVEAPERKDPMEVLILKSSSLPIPEQITEYLKNVVNIDPFNKYCIDCFTNESVYANITFGTFICYECAIVHKNIFGQSEHYIKSLTSELWDNYQLASVSPPFGGNKEFFDLLKSFNFHQ